VPLVIEPDAPGGDGLAARRRAGIVHRDIKPANIMLTRKAQAKVTDFGLARCLDSDRPVDLTRDGTTVGTPLYMSPEQVEGKPVDGRSDIYSFGVTCYHMLAGRPPFEGSGAFEVAIKHAREEPPPLEGFRRDVPPEVVALVGKMMAKKPATGTRARRSCSRTSPACVPSSAGASRSVTLGASGAQAADLDDDTSDSVPVPVWKRPVFLLAGGAVLLALVIVAGATAAVIALQQGSPRGASDKQQPSEPRRRPRNCSSARRHCARRWTGTSRRRRRTERRR